MRTTSKFSKKLKSIFIFFLLMPAVCNADSNKWVIAIQKFEYSKGQDTNSVTNATAESLPGDILEKINKTLTRNVYPDEKLERTRYKLRTERQSLYLQLNSEYKKRDSLVLNDYSEAKLKKSIQDENKKIAEIKSKIDENLGLLKEQEDKLEADMNKALSGESDNPYDDTEFERIRKLVKRIFTQEQTVITQENIAFYKDDITALYKPAQQISDDDYDSYKFEKEIYDAGINTLLTGTISSYGDYISVSVDMYTYPGSHKVTSVMEIGSVEDMDIITTSLANQLIPYLTNSMPIEMNFKVSPVEASACSIFIDDILQKTDNGHLSLQSGIHTIQIVCDGFNTAETSFYFEGNKKYNIEIEMVEMQQALLNIELRRLIPGSLIVNGHEAEYIDDTHTRIKINGNQILGEFISENGETAFFYIPEKNYYNNSYVTINPKPFDRDKYIDTRRKWMYGAYSAFMISLIPYFYTYGNLVNQADLYKNGKVSRNDAMKWQTANDVCSVIVIGCGVFWGYELVRYLVAANSVLPEKAKTPKQKKEKQEKDE